VRSLAFKWIRIVFRCWKDAVAYDETLYLATLIWRGSPLSAFVVDPVPATMLNPCGFSVDNIAQAIKQSVDRVTQMSSEPVGWIQHHQFYSGLGADIVLQSNCTHRRHR